MPNAIQPYLISLAIGLMIGIERERHPHPRQAMGVRTFVLLSLLGTFAARVESDLIAFLVTAFALSAILFGYTRSTARAKTQPTDYGLTTEISAGLVYCMGYMVPTEPIVAVSLAAGALALLSSRDWLHEFSRSVIQAREIQAVAFLVLVLFGVVPILPNSALDPWDLIYPKKIILLIGLIALFQFLGYLFGRILGDRRSFFLIGTLGGFVSSTAVFADTATRLRWNPKLVAPGVLTLLGALTGSWIALFIVVHAVSPDFALKVLACILPMAIANLLIALAIAKKGDQTIHPVLPKNPIHVASVLKLSALLSSLVILTNAIEHFIGDEALQTLAAVSGLFELHGVSVATVNLLESGQIPEFVAIRVVGIAVLASHLSKWALLAFLDRGWLAFYGILAGLLALLAGGIGFLFILQ